MRANNNNHQNHNHGTSTTQACAACKYQRRKCQPDCPLAPFFPPTHQQQFLNVHKLFGVSNVLKIIRNLDTHEKKNDAMLSIIQEANNRAADPVGGSHRIAFLLEQHLAFFEAELKYVNNQLAMFRRAAQHAQQMQMNETKLHMMNMNSNHNMIVVPVDHHQQYQEQQQLGLVPYVDNVVDPSLFNGEGASSSSSFLHVQQNQQSFLEMFDEPFLESIECRVKPEEEGEETGADEVLTEETKFIENAEGYDSKEVAPSSSLPD